MLYIIIMCTFAVMIYAVVEILDEQTVETMPRSWIKKTWKVIAYMFTFDNLYLKLTIWSWQYAFVMWHIKATTILQIMSHFTIKMMLE